MVKPNTGTTTTYQLSAEQKQFHLNNLRNSIRNCNQCEFHETRSQIVFADGDATCEIMLIGEAPGYNEDKDGIPFTGKAGQLLNKILAAAGFERKQVYLCNTNKCWPGQGNPTPNERQIKACFQYLERQIDILTPRLIIAAGNPACYSLGLLKHPSGITKIRGREYTFKGIPVIATLHPAALLRGFGKTQTEIEWDIKLKKKDAWSDWQLIAKRYKELVDASESHESCQA